MRLGAASRSDEMLGTVVQGLVAHLKMLNSMQQLLMLNIILLKTMSGMKIWTQEKVKQY